MVTLLRHQGPLITVELKTAETGDVVSSPGIRVFVPLPGRSPTPFTSGSLFFLPNCDNVAVFGKPLGTVFPAVENG